jgi:sugar O-acyltransferase (sialic acid O-acetyltransferase NeuD family)
MTEAIFGLFGTGGCARSIMPFVPAALEVALGENAKAMRVVFVDRAGGPSVNGVSVMAEQEFFASEGPRYFNIGIADASLRRKLADRALAAGATAVTLVAPGAQIYQPSQIGEGSVLCSNTVVTVNVTLGRFVHLNIGSYVEHDCVIGDFVTFAPGVHCNGAVDIGDGAYLGTGAMIRQGREGAPMRIGAGAVIGMGAVVLTDVAPAITVIGNPARPMAKQKSREQQ